MTSKAPRATALSSSRRRSIALAVEAASKELGLEGDDILSESITWDRDGTDEQYSTSDLVVWLGTRWGISETAPKGDYTASIEIDETELGPDKKPREVIGPDGRVGPIVRKNVLQLTGFVQRSATSSPDSTALLSSQIGQLSAMNLRTLEGISRVCDTLLAATERLMKSQLNPPEPVDYERLMDSALTKLTPALTAWVSSRKGPNRG